MAIRYIGRKTSRLYEAPAGGRWHMVLIFGDEVETTGPPAGSRVPAQFRGRQGFITASHLQQDPVLELYFIDVGQGDSTFIVTPGRRKILVDGGFNRRALGFLAWKYRLDQPGPPVDIDLLVVSHADSDHLDGLVPIINHPRIRVHRVIHSGIATFQPGTHNTHVGNRDPTGTFLTTRHDALIDLTGMNLSDGFAAWRNAVAAANAAYHAVDSDSAPVDIGDPSVALEVLGPHLDRLNGLPVFRWFGDGAHTINGHSVVLRLTYDQVSVLFSGDLNIEGAKHLLAVPGLDAMLDAHVFKAPHHGSHEFHPPL